MLRVDQQQFEVAFQHIVDRLPVVTDALHRHMGHPAFLEPVPRSEQVAGEGRELALLPKTDVKDAPAGWPNCFSMV